MSLLALLALASTGGAQRRSPDELVNVFARAWNAHDMKSFGEALSDDADWVTVAAARLKGRSEIQGFLDKEQSGWAKTTTMNTSSVAVRPLGTDAVTVHFNWEITGITSRDGQQAPPARGVSLFVVAKQASDWKVAAGQVALQRPTP